MSGLENSLFQLKVRIKKSGLLMYKYTSKSLCRQAQKATKERKVEEAKVKKQGENEIAKIYAQNAIRKQQESVNLLRLASRIDTVSSRVQTAVLMRGLTGNMQNVVRGMDKAMQSMNLERISAVMDKFERQFEDLDVQSSYMDNAMGESSVQMQPQEEVDGLMSRIADENGIERSQQLGNTVPSSLQPNSDSVELDLQERLRAIRSL